MWGNYLSKRSSAVAMLAIAAHTSRLISEHTSAALPAKVAEASPLLIPKFFAMSGVITPAASAVLRTLRNLPRCGSVGLVSKNAIAARLASFIEVLSTLLISHIPLIKILEVIINPKSWLLGNAKLSYMQELKYYCEKVLAFLGFSKLFYELFNPLQDAS